MRRDRNINRAMLLIIFMNAFCTFLNFFSGDISAGFGWGVALMWSIKCHSLEIKLLERKAEEEENRAEGQDQDKE